ncbi:predicted protein [Ostreococcus lucimarinus CCE9901]|uniref:Uncharacterized protein n=1 Tax=Ostreococcus lucimarinus (strain CCE9901) TaxID=436017 RepID=A4RTK2_OSTLU|nr:predicted protein [Ostreococcus lucimarinus CCE9901]ABO94596.1 predicted protein [Ostreococcus lucimarinus CCE9901]|eukprot:XP_001416303.1 predicted protein [Ostreococcus lucimarinus CCE9901]
MGSPWSFGVYKSSKFLRSSTTFAWQKLPLRVVNARGLIRLRPHVLLSRRSKVQPTALTWVSRWLLSTVACSIVSATSLDDCLRFLARDERFAVIPKTDADFTVRLNQPLRSNELWFVARFSSCGRMFD